MSGDGIQPPGVDRRLAAILVADVVGWSRQMERDDEATLRALKRIRGEVIDPAISRHRGRIVKSTGDGVLVEFASVVDSLRCALEVQESLAKRPAGAGDAALQLRIGVNLGDVIVDGDDIFGDGVNVASRLQSLADEGGICISHAVWEQVRGRVIAELEDRGDIRVKNIERPIRVYAVRAVAPAAGARHGPAEAPTGIHKSIAVLPFANMSSDPENEFFSDGISEELINLFTKLPQLRVSSRTSSFAFKEKSLSVRAIAAELGVKTVLEGSVRRAGNRVRITAQLIDTDSDSHLWSETYDRELDDIFAVQDEIAHRIVEALEISLSPGQERAIQKVPTSDVRAYDSYLRGRKYFHEQRGGSMDQALRMFGQAIELDPAFARAYAGIADAAAYKYTFYDRDEAHLEQAAAASRKALELDPELAEAHAAHGHVLALQKRYDEAAREFETAIRLDPQLYEAYFFYARSEFVRGNIEKTALLYEKASAVQPEDYKAPILVASMYEKLGQDEAARIAMLRGLQTVERHLELNPDDQRALSLGSNVQLQIGSRERALEWARRAMALNPGSSTVYYNLACFYVRAGEVDKALECLTKRIEGGALPREWIENDSDFDPIRDDPRFQALVSRL
ncbi:MAG TPA: adenylate/guanylate cyclase domain-containing protein [Gemmatimonadota bacterium]|nr:adenylate/guanylate cyclase domain-containing protein [Gemmatimonadota bacterium]